MALGLAPGHETQHRAEGCQAFTEVIVNTGEMGRYCPGPGLQPHSHPWMLWTLALTICQGPEDLAASSGIEEPRTETRIAGWMPWWRMVPQALSRPLGLLPLLEKDQHPCGGDPRELLEHFQCRLTTSSSLGSSILALV